MTEERLRELLWELINCATDHNYEGIDAFQEQIVEEVIGMTIKPGVQVTYVPTHAKGGLDHPDCEDGFVTSVGHDFAWCRYWSRADPTQLRTRGNAEATYIQDLIVRDTHPQSEVDELLRIYG